MEHHHENMTLKITLKNPSNAENWENILIKDVANTKIFSVGL